MTFWSSAEPALPFLVVGAALLGLVLSPFTELLIARLMPRLGGLPAARTRTATAVVTGAACAAFAVRFGTDSSLPAYVLAAVLGVQLARIDIAVHLLPNRLVFTFLVAGLASFLTAAVVGSQWDGFVRAAAGGTALFTFYLILALVSPGAIGMGDVKLAGPIGLYLGHLGWTHLLYGGLLGFVINGVVTAALVLGGGRNRPNEVAHGPSMLTAAAAAALFLPVN